MIRDELTFIEDSIITWGLRVVVPTSLRNFLLPELRRSHPGITIMKALARIHIWYPQINADIENWVKKCTECLQTSNAPSAAQPHHWEWSSKPMQRVHLDIFGPFYEHQAQVMVDAYSGWIEVLVMADAYSGWIEAQVVKKIYTKTTTKVIRRWISITIWNTPPISNR